MNELDRPEPFVVRCCARTTSTRPRVECVMNRLMLSYPRSSLSHSPVDNWWVLVLIAKYSSCGDIGCCAKSAHWSADMVLLSAWTRTLANKLPSSSGTAASKISNSDSEAPPSCFSLSILMASIAQRKMPEHRRWMSASTLAFAESGILNQPTLLRMYVEISSRCSS